MKLGDHEKTELRDLLKEVGLKQKQLAAMMGIHPQVVNRSLSSKGVLTQKFYTQAKANLIESTKLTKKSTGSISGDIADLAHEIATLPDVVQRTDMIVKTMGDITPKRIMSLYRELIECLKPPKPARFNPAKVDDPVPPVASASPEN